MKIGFIGLGKLGLPVALSVESKGHQVIGWDASEVVRSNISARTLPYKEVGAQELLTNSKLELSQDFNGCDIVFMAIQTPHDHRFEGTVRIPEERADFDYSYLIQAVKDFVQAQTTPVTLVLISTVLPGTIEREIRPLLSDKISFVYNPFFIAMGTVIPDFTNPEFVLIGRDPYQVDDHMHPIESLKAFYRTIHDKPLIEMPIRDAELTKVAYNTFIGMKIVFVNTLMEICHKNGGNVDNITNALKQATDRLISPKYLSAGMGDGGGCHPRDNIAMSHIARVLGLSHNFFDDLMMAREHQTEFLADLIVKKHQETKLPILILGRSFKPETNIETGSPAILLGNLLDEIDVDFQQLQETDFIKEPTLVFIGTQNEIYAHYNFPRGSIVIDPFGYMPEQEGVEIIRIGRNK